jgi:hypothetical protein
VFGLLLCLEKISLVILRAFHADMDKALPFFFESRGVINIIDAYTRQIYNDFFAQSFGMLVFLVYDFVE